MFQRHPPRRARIAFALLLSGAAVPARASYCVDTVAELRAALAAAAESAFPVEQVRLREGHYVIEDGSALGLFVAQGGKTIEISGGWSGEGGACAHKRTGSTATVIETATPNQVLAINMLENISGSTVVVYDVTLRNATGWVHAPACLSVSVPAGNAALVERVRLDQCRTLSSDTLDASAARFGGSGSMTLRNLAITGGEGPGAALRVGVHGGATARLAQISITGHHVSAATATVGGLALVTVDSTDRIHLGNSVIAGNTGAPATSLLIGGAFSTVSLNRVHYQSLSGFPLANVAPGTGDPGFVAPGDAHLLPDSVLLDSGTADPEGGTGIRDVEGRLRVLGAAVDVGAYEFDDAIFRYGFE